MADNKTLQIEILDEIGGWGFNLTDLVDRLKGFKGEKISVPINTYGGSVLEGLSIYNTLIGRSEVVETSVIGYALSMGSVLLCAGNVSKMPKNGYLMLHNPIAGIFGDAEDMDRVNMLLTSMKKTIVDIYHNKTGLDKGELSAMMDAETWLTGQEALDAGFVDELTEGVDLQSAFSDFEFNNYVNAPKELLNKFSNSKKVEKMDIKSFLNKLIPGLSKFGIKVENDATPEDVVNAVEEAKSFDDFKNELTTQITASVTDKVIESLGQKKVDEKKIDDEAQAEAIAKAVNDAIQPLNKKISDLEDELAEAKGKKETRKNSQGFQNSKTKEAFFNKLESVSPEGDSKY